MDFNRQHQQNLGPQAAQSDAFGGPKGKESKKSGNGLGSNALVGWALVAVCVIMVVFGLLWYFRGTVNEAGRVNKDEYQAVFLSNGQVYFGHLDTLNSQYLELKNIFYLQAKQAVQPKQGSDNSTDQNNVQLVKLGNELHGPEDSMQINRDQVVFWENLKKDGKVTQAIDKFQKNGGNASTNSSTSNSDSSNSSNSNSSSSDKKQ